MTISYGSTIDYGITFALLILAGSIYWGLCLITGAIDNLREAWERVHSSRNQGETK